MIKSVFSGMARSIIHNSDYKTLDDAKAAIDRYFAERNAHFTLHPKRAGKKIWGKEREVVRILPCEQLQGPALSLKGLWDGFFDHGYPRDLGHLGGTHLHQPHRLVVFSALSPMARMRSS